MSSNRLPLLTLGLALLCALLACAPDAVQAALAYDRPSLMHGEWWRLWTGHVVHFSPRHAAMDGIALLLLGAMAEREAGRRTMLVGAFAGAPLVSIGLWFWVPEMTAYRGISAVTGLYATVLAVSLWQTTPRYRALLLLLAIVWALKMMGEASGIGFFSPALPAGVSAAWQAHLMGMGLGVMLGWAAAAPCLWSRRRKCRSTATDFRDLQSLRRFVAEARR